jgi:hypothetical protein
MPQISWRGIRTETGHEFRLQVVSTPLYFRRYQPQKTGGKKMLQDNTAPADMGDEEQQSTGFAKKRPALLYDNGHGTKVVRWDEGISNLQIERSYMPKGETDPSKRVTEKLNLTPEEALGVMFGLEKGVEQHMEKLQFQRQSQSR